jgi:hypothetical protein
MLTIVYHEPRIHWDVQEADSATVCFATEWFEVNLAID